MTPGSRDRQERTAVHYLRLTPQEGCGSRIVEQQIYVYKSPISYTCRGPMRTNIDIDDDLMAEAMKVTGLTTKKETVEEGLRRLVRQSYQRRAIQKMKGMGWEGDLDAMREGRDFGNPL